MNKYIKFLTLGLAFSGLIGCSNVLEIEDLGNYGPDNVWNDEKLSSAYLANLYSLSFSGWPVNRGANADEVSGIMGKDAVMPNNNTFKYWPYSNIYKINTMLEGVEGGSLKEELKLQLRSEACFLRAYHYFKALIYHGGIPYIDYVQQQGGDDLYVKRNSSPERFDLIIKDLDESIAHFPEKNSGVY